MKGRQKSKAVAEDNSRGIRREIESNLKPLLGTIEIDTKAIKSKMKKSINRLANKSRAEAKTITSNFWKKSRSATRQVEPRIKHTMAVTIRKTINELERLENQLE
jgi:hypothetical protein